MEIYDLSTLEILLVAQVVNTLRSFGGPVTREELQENSVLNASVFDRVFKILQDTRLVEQIGEAEESKWKLTDLARDLIKVSKTI